MLRLYKRPVAWLLALCALLFACYVCRAPLLTGLAKAWIVNDQPLKADAIVVLCGGEQYRPFEAARLYREGFASKILVIRVKVKLSPTDRLGVTFPCTELNKQVLLHSGVPESAVVLIGDDVRNTREEALATCEWVRRTGARTVLIPTELFHTRRVAWIFRKILDSSGATFRVIALAPEEYTASNWWQHEESLRGFPRELIKFARYLVIY